MNIAIFSISLPQFVIINFFIFCFYLVCIPRLLRLKTFLQLLTIYMSSLDIFSHLLSIFNFFLFICRSCLHWRLFFCYIYYKHFHSITVIHLKLKVTIFKKSNTPSLYIGPGFSLCFLIKKTKTTINGSRFCRKSLYPALHFFED